MTERPIQFDPDHRQELVAAAIQAPSMHNTQPWRFRFTGDRVEVHRDPRRELPVEDPQRRNSLISAGAAVFNLRVAAEHAGYQVAATLHNQTDRTLVAEIRLVARTPDGEKGPLDELYRYLAVRRSNRNPYAESVIPAAVRAALVTAAADEGAMLDWVQDQARRDWLLSLSADANLFDNTDLARRAERGRWVGGDRDREGVPSSALGPRPKRRSAPVRDLAANRSDRVRPTAEFEVEPSLAVITTRYDMPKSWLVAGQALEHVWLEATRHGLAVSLLTQAVEHAELRWLVRDPRAGWSEPQVVIRFGYGPEVPATPRRPVSEFIDLAEELRRGESRT
jgi:nitroreductase